MFGNESYGGKKILRALKLVPVQVRPWAPFEFNSVSRVLFLSYKCYNKNRGESYMKESKPLYFYHLINKDSNLEKGILSLQYMYNNKMYDLFDKNAAKYTHRITIITKRLMFFFII